jgi:hypothetical protein
MVGQASSLSITDDGQDARPTGNLGSGGVPRDAGFRSARNDNLLPPVAEDLPCTTRNILKQRLPNGTFAQVSEAGAIL